MKIEVLRNVFQRNDHAAAENRALFDERGILCLNLLGGAGSGKTAVLETILPQLMRRQPTSNEPTSPSEPPTQVGGQARTTRPFGPNEAPVLRKTTNCDPASPSEPPTQVGIQARSTRPFGLGDLPPLALRPAVLEGDLATTRDAQRIAALGVPVVQLLTDGGCHLTATLVQQGLTKLPLDAIDLLIIENVGNPICPANFNLGEHHRISVLSVAEGDDKPVKYPLLFKDADTILITKCDLLPHTTFDLRRAVTDLTRLNPTARILQTTARHRSGFDTLLARIATLHQARAKAPAMIA